MESNGQFWAGLFAGMLAGTALGVLSPCGKRSMRTQVGRSIHKLGDALDHAVDNIVSEMR